MCTTRRTVPREHRIVSGRCLIDGLDDKRHISAWSTDNSKVTGPPAAPSLPGAAVKELMTGVGGAVKRSGIAPEIGSAQASESAAEISGRLKRCNELRRRCGSRISEHHHLPFPLQADDRCHSEKTAIDWQRRSSQHAQYSLNAASHSFSSGWTMPDYAPCNRRCNHQCCI